MNPDSGKVHKPHPRTIANPLSIITFGWTHELFQKGNRKELEVDDMYEVLDEDVSDKLGDKFESTWNNEMKKNNTNTKFSLFKVIFKLYGPRSILLGAILGIMEMAFRLTQPLFLGRLIRYFTPESDVDRNMAYLYAACIIICSAVLVVTKQSYMLAMFHNGMKLRVGLCSLIYRKTLKLSEAALRETTIGQAVNLISNDVNRFDMCLLFIVYIWIGPVHCLIIGYILWGEIGWSAIIGVTALVFFIPFQVYLGKRISTLRMRTAKRTDERIRFMNEIIIAIQLIKMYAWEKPFAHLVSLARRFEIKAIRAAGYTKCSLLSFEQFSTRFTVFITVVTYYLLGNNITAEKVYVVTAYFNILRTVLADFFPRAIQALSECYVSVTRIQTFLLYDEVASSHKNEESRIITDENDKPVGNNCIITESAKDTIVMNNISAKWSDDLPDNTLTNVHLVVKPGQLVAVIGPVGAGKTSIIHAILKELPLSSGSISVGGTISYASQEPWLFSGSVRHNILFGLPMNKQRYKQVVRVCALERDFEMFPYGDKTIVGERGVTLSGGQKARVNLARAIYKEADVYLLDDPLSAVDTHVGRHLFEDCICDFLQNKTRLLITHQVQYLQTADNIVILNNGIIEATGTFSDLQESGLDFAKQLGLESEDMDENVNKEFHKSLSRDIKRQDSETSQLSVEPKQALEMRSRGTVDSRVYKTYFGAGGHWFIILSVLGICALSQLIMRSSDYWMAYWTNIEEIRMSSSVDSTSNMTVNNTFPSFITSANESNFNLTLNESEQTVDMASRNITDSQEFGWIPSTETCMYIYIGLILVLVNVSVLSACCIFAVCMRISIKLHDSMFAGIIRATMQFFYKHPSGQILNRFSKDMGNIDERLPYTLFDCVQIGLSLCGVVLLVAVVNVWLLFPTVLMFILFYLIRQYYLATSRSLKRLESITRSPVFTQLSASLQGLATIRAFGAQSMLEREFDNYQDVHSSIWYVYIATNRAFGLWLDSVCIVFIGLVTFSFFIVGGEQYGGDVGLAITQAIGLTGMLQWGIRQSAELENQMTSVERVLEYTLLEKEPSEENILEKRPPAGWPTKGAIVFDRIILAYSKTDPAVLKNVSFVIKPGEKVGIVGRTGAGKSSLITALFRLVEISNGSIRIDGVDITLIGLHDLRSKVSIIPQEPSLFSGPLRENLDPFNQYSDAVLWSALDEVELKQAVKELPAGLTHKVSEGGSNFSVGQRQLLCLARAIIRNNKILVLDEATANVDPQTDELIQATIRRKFADCTVLTIAHRLHTVMDSDRVIVMDAGSVVEFEHPYLLLQNENGLLNQMVQQTGHAMAESLHRAAEASYEKVKFKKQ